MSGVLDLTVAADPGACRSAASELAGAATALGTTSTHLSGFGDRAGRAWAGIAADVFVERLNTTRKDVDELSDRIGSLGRALDSFASELDVVRSSMADARAVSVPSLDHPFHQCRGASVFPESARRVGRTTSSDRSNASDPVKPKRSGD